MLQLRLVIFAVIGGIALWSLFSLLDTLREPELLRSAKAVVVKGCDPLESDAAIRSCPTLFCQKAVLDAHLVPLRAMFSVTTDKRDGQRQLIAGSATAPGNSAVLYACVLERDKVVSAQIIDRKRMGTLATQSSDWTLEP